MSYVEKLINQMHIVTLTPDEVCNLHRILSSAMEDSSGVSIWHAPAEGVMLEDGTRHPARITARYEYADNGNEGFSVL